MKRSKGRKALDVDMISNLPDHILHLVLSCLPTTEEVTRTTILSIRWRHLWTSVPSIDIDYSRGLKFPRETRKSKFEEFVCLVLANKSVDLDSFRLCCDFYYNMCRMWQWIGAAIKRNVKILDLRFCSKEKYEDIIELPSCLVTCHSLEVLRLSLCASRLMLPKVTGFSALRVLELKNCKFLNGNFVRDFLKSCPVLEDLSLVYCITFDLDLFCISCPNLKNLGIDNLIIIYSEDPEYGAKGMCKRLQICCPKLESLKFSGFMAREFIFESLDSLKKVVIGPLNTYELANQQVHQLFAEFSHVESLSLRIWKIQEYITLEDLPESLPNLKTLELITTNDAFNINALIQILIRSSNLESLHLIIQKGPSYDLYPRQVHGLKLWEMDYDCIFERLKMVKMTGMLAVTSHIGFIEFLLQRSPFLGTMSITTCVDMTDERLNFLANGVLKYPRASPQAEIIFVQDQM